LIKLLSICIHYRCWYCLPTAIGNANIFPWSEVCKMVLIVQFQF